MGMWAFPPFSEWPCLLIRDLILWIDFSWLSASHGQCPENWSQISYDTLFCYDYFGGFVNSIEIIMKANIFIIKMGWNPSDIYRNQKNLEG